MINSNLTQKPKNLILVLEIFQFSPQMDSFLVLFKTLKPSKKIELENPKISVKKGL